MAIFKMTRFTRKESVSPTSNARRTAAARRKQATRFMLEGLEQRALLATTTIQPVTESQLEGNGNFVNPAEFQYTVTRTLAANEVAAAQTINYTTNGTGANPANQFDFNGAFPSGSFIFPALTAGASGATQTQTISLPINNDTIPEQNETFAVTLTASPGSISPTVVTGTIVNDDSSVAIAASPGEPVGKTEGNTGASPATNFLYTVTRSAPAGIGSNPQAFTDAVTVFYQVNGSSVFTTGNPPVADSPADASDFVGLNLPSGQVTIPANQTTATITVSVNGDTVVEPNEDFTVAITSTSNTGNNVSISATNGTVSSQIINDDTTTLTLSYAPPVGNITNVSKNEGNTGANPATQYFYVVTRTGDLSGQTTVFYQVNGSGAFGDPAADANDFVGGVLPQGQITFGQNSSTSTITVNVNGDTVLEPNEDFTVTLTGANPATTLFGTNAISSQIVNDDALNLGIVSGDADKAEGNSGANPFSFIVTRTGDTSSTTTVNYVVTGSTTPTGFAANGLDFTGGSLPSGTITFAQGVTTQTITVNVNGDTTVEPDEGFQVALQTVNLPAGTTIAPNPAFGIIRNDDSPIISISPANAILLEGNSGTTPFTFNVTRTGDTSTSSTVNYAVINLPVVPPPSPGNPSPAGINTADFGNTTPSGSVAFGPGETSKVITIFVTGDTEVEADEQFAVQLSSPTGASLGTVTAIGMIVNDDAGVAITFVQNPNQAFTPPDTTGNFEGNAGATTPFTFVLTRSGNTSGTTTVSYAVNGGVGNPPALGGSPANAADFTGNTLPSGTVTFAPGQTTTTLTINVNGDNTLESDETFTVSLSNPNPNTTQLGAVSTATIFNDDEQFTLVVNNTAPNNASAVEGNTGTTPFVFTINRSTNFTQDVAVVNYAVTGGNATNTSPADPNDFGGVFPSGQVVFGVGDTQKQVTILVTGDNTPEPNESFLVTLTNAVPSQTNVSINTGTNGANNMTILNDDSTLSIGISQFSSVSQLEGNNGATTQYVYFVTRTIPGNGFSNLGPLTATYSVTGTGANPADQFDFTGNVLPTNLPITFGNPGNANTQTATVTVSVNGDNTLEADETFLVTLNPGPGVALAPNASAPGTIRNDDPGLGIVATTPILDEGNSGTTPFIFTVTRTGDASQAVAVNYTVSGSGPNPADTVDFGGTAGPPATPLPSGQVVLGVGETTKDVTVFVTGDTTVEPDEQFTVTLGATNPGGISVNPASASATIRNDDFARTVSVAPLNAFQNEGNNGVVTPFTFTITRSGDTTVLTSVQYQVTGITADQFDFSGNVLPNGIVFFNPGDTSIVITVPVNGDNVVEPNEQFSVAITNTNNAQTIGGSATGTIVNDDVFIPANLSIAASNAVQFEGTGGTTLFSFTVTRSGDTTTTTTANYAVTGSTLSTGSAADAQDFSGGVFPSGTVNFGPGVTTQTIFIPVNGDSVGEPAEGFAVTLSNANPAGSLISQATAQGTILNDDAIVQNQPPTLSQPASGNSLASPGTSQVFLQATDPNGDPLTFTATSQNLDRSLQSTYNFFQENGTYYTNARGGGEKYLKSPISFLGRPPQPGSPNGYYYFITPNGNLYEFQDAYNSPALNFGPSNLVANLGPAAYNDPTLLTNAQFTNLGLSVSGNQLTITMPAGVANGTQFVITATVSDGHGGTDTKTFTLFASNQAANQPPTLAQPGDVTVAAGTTIPVSLQGSDPEGAPLTYSATSQNLDRSLQNTYNFFQENGTFYTNARNQGEKYIKSAISFTGRPIQPTSPNGYYYFILPNGNLYEYVDPYTSGALTQGPGNLVGNIGTGGYNNPFALINASFANLSLNVSGNQLLITVPAGVPSGTVFVVTANVSDGQASASRTFRVNVS